MRFEQFRQRLSLEFRTGRDICSDELVENFIEDLTKVTNIKRKEIIVLTYVKSGVVAIDILSKASFLISDVLNVVEYWFDPKEVDIL